MKGIYKIKTFHMQLQYKKKCNGRQKMKNRSGDTATFAEKPRANPSSLDIGTELPENVSRAEPPE